MIQSATICRLYRHTKRPQWGLALQAWERDKRRAYQFEDGKLRVLKEKYWGLMAPVELPGEERERRVRSLRLRLNLTGLAESSNGSPRGLSGLSFVDQLEIFSRLHPQGFAGSKWVREVRGRGAKRRLKRHREVALRHARAALAQESVHTLLEEGREQELVEQLDCILKRTDLVTPSQLRLLRGLPRAQVRALARLLSELIYGDGAFEDRFRRVVSALRAGGRQPSWNLVTAPLALVHPERHVCVRPGLFRAQGKILVPSLQGSAFPSAELYQCYRALAETVAGKLRQAGLQPRDLMDVHDFMLVTLAPKSRQLLLKGPREEPNAA